MAALDAIQRYGNSFQIKIIALLIQQKVDTSKVLLIDKVIDFLDENHFEHGPVRILIEIIKSHYIKYKKAPMPDEFAIELKKLGLDEVVMLSVRDTLMRAYESLKKGGLEYVEDEFLQFCQTRALISAVLKSVDHINDGTFDLIKPTIDNAMKISMVHDFGMDYASTVDDRINKNPRKNVIPTPWPAINELIDGGLGAGDLGCIIAPSGAGKSWVLSALGLQALRIGKNVLHISLELGDTYTGLRYDSILTGIKAEQLKYHQDILQMKMLTEVKGNMRVKYFPTKSVNVAQIKSFMSSLLAVNFKPDILILDYADILAPELTNRKQSSTYEDSGNIYEYLRGIGGEFDIPVWTASQTNRNGESTNIVTNSDIADSFKKIFTSDVVLTLARNIDDKANKTARMFLAKNRYGIDGILFPVRMNTDAGVIEVFTEASSTGKKLMIDMKRNSGNAMKKTAREEMKKIKEEDAEVQKLNEAFIESITFPDNVAVPSTENELDDFMPFKKNSSTKNNEDEFDKW